MTCRAFCRLSVLFALVFFIFQIGVCFTQAQDPAQSTDKGGTSDVLPPRREPIRVGGNVQARKLVNRIAPVYPEEAKKAHISGTVVLQVTVNEQGQVWDVVPISGHALLKDAAVNAVRQWTYQPTELNGEPVPVIATVTVNFVLISDGKHAAEPVGLLLRMDAAGILWDGDMRLEGKQLIDRAMEAGGAVQITPDPDVPLGILRETLQVLHHAGIRVSVRVPSSQHDLLFESLVETTRKLGYGVVGLRMGFDPDPSHSGWSKAKGPHDAELSLQYELAADEMGSVTAVKQVEGPEVPEITSTLSQQRLEGYLFPSTIIVKIWLKKN